MHRDLGVRNGSLRGSRALIYLRSSGPHKTSYGLIFLFLWTDQETDETELDGVPSKGMFFLANQVDLFPDLSLLPETVSDTPQRAGGKLEARDDTYVESLFTVKEADIKANNFKRLEHITVTVTIEHQRRGDVEVTLTSPHGIVSHKAGFSNWTFMSVAHWDEDQIGEWKLRVSDVFNPDSKGTFKNWWIALFGESNQQQSSPSTPLKPSTSTTTTATRSTAIAAGPPATTPVTKQTPEVSSNPDAITSDGNTTPVIDGGGINKSPLVAIFFGIGAFVTVSSILYIPRKRFVAAREQVSERTDWRQRK
ncbi:galactose-binding domain-like protein [Cladochytrium replicatum]|nr:galactose-binding domain-like protein [Cladochytrium replicatum]